MTKILKIISITGEYVAAIAWFVCVVSFFTKLSEAEHAVFIVWFFINSVMFGVKLSGIKND